MTITPKFILNSFVGLLALIVAQASSASELATSAPLSAVAISGQNLITGKAIDIASGKKGSVLVFMSAKCPCSNNHVGIIKNLAAQFKDFSFVAIHSNVDEDRETSQKYFSYINLPFPVIRDADGKLADEYKALKTPHAFVIGADKKILYKGGVTSSSRGSLADTQFLNEALIDLAAGREVKVALGRTLGCMISRGEKNVW